MPYYQRAIVVVTALLLNHSAFSASPVTSTNEPKDEYLNLHLTLSNFDDFPSFRLDSDYSLVFSPTFTSAVVQHDDTSGFNILNILAEYSLYRDGAQISPSEFISIRCPITSTTTIDRSSPSTTRYMYGEVYSVTHLKRDTLSEKTLYAGSYKFLSLPKQLPTDLKLKLKQQGVVTDDYYLKGLCTSADLSYVRYKSAEIKRKNVLKGFGISE